jgi:probable F420-dependent oxidoreductase
MTDMPPTIGRAGIWTHHFDVLGASRCRELAAEIESQGWGSIWFPETLGRDAVSNAWLLLGATKSITVASGIASIWARNPVGMASAQQAIEEAFPGRFLLGLGVSHAPMVEFVHQKAYDKPYSAMVAYLDAMDASAYMSPKPAHPPRRVLAALGDRMLTLAASKASGAHPYLVTPEHTAHAREVMGQGPLLVPELRAYLGPRDEALEAGRQSFAIYSTLPNYLNNLRRLGFHDDDFADNGSDRLIDAIVAHGSVDDIKARADEHLAAGADSVALQVINGSLTEPPLDVWRELAPALTGS